LTENIFKRTVYPL